MMRAEVRSARRPRTALELTCPFCDEGVAVPLAKCVEGATVRCPRCAAEPELTRERIEHTRRYRWILVDPNLEALDDERRQA